jgi:hypothetical protein
MKWTREPPTKPGWYWYKHYNYEGEQHDVVVIMQNKKHLYANLMQIHLGRRKLSEFIKSFHVKAWAGPIQEPTEPEE